MTVCPACSISTDTRRRLSRGSSEVHVSQLQAMEGTPVDVPVPRNVSFISQLMVREKSPPIYLAGFLSGSQINKTPT